MGKEIKTANNKTSLWITIAIVAILVASILLTVLASTGIAGRGTTIIESDNFEVDANMLTYFEYQNYSNTYYYYISLYAQMVGDTNTAVQYAQQMMQNQGITLKSFYQTAVDSLKDVLILCEAAKAEGMAIDDEDKKIIDEAIAQYTNISSTFGKGVTAKDIRKAMELQQLASKYAEKFTEEAEAAVTQEDKDKYMEENKASFYVMNYLNFKIEVLAKDYEDNSDGFAAAKALADEYIAKLEAAKSADEFKTAVVEYIVKTEFDALAQKEISSALMPNAEALETYKSDIAAKIVKLVCDGEEIVYPEAEKDSLEEDINSITKTLAESCEKACSSTEQAYAEEKVPAEGETLKDEEKLSEQVKWLVDAARKAGDTYKISDSDEDEYTNTVYFVERELHIIEDVTKDVGHILVKAEKDKATEAQIAEAKAKAEQILADFLATDKTEESFEKIGKEKTEDSNVFYDDVEKGDMVAEFEEWLFDEARQVGDTGIVQSDYGFHVMLYRGGSTLADTNALNGVVNEKYEAYIEANLNKVTVNEKAADKYGK